MRHAERGAGGRRAARVDRGRRDRRCSRRTPRGLTAQVRELVEDGELRERLGGPRARAPSVHVGARRPRRNLDRARAAVARRRAARLRDALRALGDRRARPGLAAATLANNAIALLFTVVFARLLGAAGYGSLAALLATFLILPVAGLGAAGRRGARGRPAASARRRGCARRCAAGRGSCARGSCGASSRRSLREPLAALSGRRALGGGRDAPDGLPVAAAVGRARRAPGHAALPAVGWSIVGEAGGGSSRPRAVAARAWA